MADNSHIEWTDATWNPVSGCTKISSGCDYCYAEWFSERFRNVKDHPFENGFDLTLILNRLDQPTLWKKPRMIFVNSMSDLFRKKIPEEYIDRVFEVMEGVNQHIYQMLMILVWAPKWALETPHTSWTPPSPTGDMFTPGHPACHAWSITP